MPYHGLSSFLRYAADTNSDTGGSFNALPRAFFFSTNRIVEEMLNVLLFQCPTTGFLLFYEDYTHIITVADTLFQCPTTGFLLFYNCGKIMQSKKMVCFNALPRAFFFSTIIKGGIVTVKHVFQCPTTGFLLFYFLNVFALNPDTTLFQCPTTGFLLFY